MRELHVAPDETPIVHLARPGAAQPEQRRAGRAIGLRTPLPRDGVCDLVVVGAGPAGLAASVYGASEGLDTVTVDAVGAGGQAGTTMRIENYLGFPAGISGSELADRASVQARRFGARISVPAEATGLTERGGDHVVALEDGSELVARSGHRRDRRALPQAAGPAARGVRGRERLLRRDADRGASLRGRHRSRSSAAATRPGRPRCSSPITSRASSLIVREDRLEENMSRYLADRIRRNPRIELRLHTRCASWWASASSRTSSSRTVAAASAAGSARGTCSCSSAPTPYTRWLARPGPARRGRLRAHRPDAGRRAAMLETSGPASSRSATCGAERSSASRRRWGEGDAMAVRSCTSTWRSAPAQTNISSTKHQRQSSPGSNERTIGWPAASACRRAWRFGDESQQPT